MVNNLAIFIAHAALIFVAIRALMLDSQLPWFESAEEETGRKAKEEESSAARSMGARRRNGL